jgi:hypothetical protein
MIDLQHFTKPNKNISHLEPGSNPFRFVDRNSNNLLVTIGDSWTWGDELKNPQDEAFGNLLSQRLAVDHLNLSVCGAGNHYIGQLFDDFIAYIEKHNNYQHKTCIVVLTEAARDFNGWFDRKVDYASWIKKHVNTASDYYKFLEFIDDFTVNKILKANTVPNLEILVAYNFVSPAHNSKLGPLLLDKTWLEVIVGAEMTDYCRVISPYIFKKLEAILELENSADPAIFRQWQIELLEQANKRLGIMENNQWFHVQRHPGDQGHKLWADYILEQLKFKKSKILTPSSLPLCP